MEKGVGDTPLLSVAIEGDGLVVESYDLAAALMVLLIQESDGIADRHFISTQALLRCFAHADIDTIDVDGGIGEPP